LEAGVVDVCWAGAVAPAAWDLSNMTEALRAQNRRRGGGGSLQQARLLASATARRRVSAEWAACECEGEWVPCTASRLHPRFVTHSALHTCCGIHTQPLKRIQRIHALTTDPWSVEGAALLGVYIPGQAPCRSRSWTRGVLSNSRECPPLSQTCRRSWNRNPFLMS
jgi:hypothetical protein